MTSARNTVIGIIALVSFALSVDAQACKRSPLVSDTLNFSAVLEYVAAGDPKSQNSIVKVAWWHNDKDLIVVERMTESGCNARVYAVQLILDDPSRPCFLKVTQPKINGPVECE